MSQRPGTPLWCLCHLEKNLIWTSLSESEIYSITQHLTGVTANEWWVWREGWKSWKNLTEVKELSLAPPMRREIAPPSLILVEDEPSIRTAVTRLTDSGAPKSLRRKNRVQARYGVEVISNGRSFHSHSRDLSLGGVRLEDTLPEWVAGYCSLVLTDLSNKKSLEFVATIVENQEVNDKTRLEFQSSEALAILEQWLKIKTSA